jgi:hypothetical protein
MTNCRRIPNFRVRKQVHILLALFIDATAFFAGLFPLTSIPSFVHQLFEGTFTGRLLFAKLL